MSNLLSCTFEPRIFHLTQQFSQGLRDQSINGSFNLNSRKRSFPCVADLHSWVFVFLTCPLAALPAALEALLLSSYTRLTWSWHSRTSKTKSEVWKRTLVSLAWAVNVCERVSVQRSIAIGQSLIIFPSLSLLCFWKKKGLKRTSVFERLGAESKADATNSAEVRSSCGPICSL